MRSRALVASFLVTSSLLPACGESNAESVTGSWVNTYLTDTGEKVVRDDPSTLELAALVHDDSGAATWVGATTGEDLSYSIEGVPQGAYTLYMNSTPAVILVTDRRSLDLGGLWGGRPDAVAMTKSTSLLLNVKEMTAWNTNDRLELTSLGAGAWVEFSDHADLAAGDTELSAFAVDCTRWTGGKLVDGDAGDQVTITHLTTRPVGFSGYVALAEVFRPASFSQTDGGANLLQGAFEPVTQKHVSLTVDRDAFDELVPVAHPAAAMSFHQVYAYVEPAGAERASAAAPARLFDWTDGDPGDVTHELDYGDPFPDAWAEVGWSLVYYGVDLDVPWEGWPNRATGYAGVRATLSELAGGKISPRLGPPGDLRIGGEPAYAGLTSVGTAPTISWTAPELGKAAVYQVTIDAIAEGARSTVLSAYTTATELAVPEKILAAGARYLVKVTARDSFDPASPFVYRNRAALADALSGVVVP